MTDQVVLECRNLSVSVDDGTPIIQDVSLTLERGQVLGIVGESGCGKTTTALGLLGYARRGTNIVAGSVTVDGHEMLGRKEKHIRDLRGGRIAYVPQDPSSSLNPAHRIGNHVADMLRQEFPRGAIPDLVTKALERAQLPGDKSFQRRFPHELSGGQQQRVAIAMALALDPPVAIFDEPTTGLDVITQALVLAEVERLRSETGLALVYVSHDIAVVASLADRIAVMYAGRIVEEGPLEQVLSAPKHPYSLGLLSSVPDHIEPRALRGIPGVAVGIGERPPGCPYEPRCPQRVDGCVSAMPPVETLGPGHDVRCFEWQRTPARIQAPILEPASPAKGGRPLLEVDSLLATYPSRTGTVIAARDVSFTVASGECLALVGESGSGKTTIARCVAGLHSPAAGTILLDDIGLSPTAKERPREARRRIQIVFQNPNDSLNPLHRVENAIARPARFLRGLSRDEAAAEVFELLEQVRLPTRLANRFPGELSGGERQRVAIARALAARPDLMICDEITSALDVSVQAAVLDLLTDLRVQLGLAVLFISHDLGVVATVADRVLILERGELREEGTARGLLTQPSHSYTQALVEAAPRLPAVSSETTGAPGSLSNQPPE